MAPAVETAAPTDSDLCDLGLIGTSEAHQTLCDDIHALSGLDIDVTLLGDSGVGKTTIAKIIHKLSPRRQGPWRDINCASIPEGLIDAELFGSEKGAFTGSNRLRKGLFEQAQGGTLFLDEVAELSHSLQAKLLKVVETKTIQRLGGDEPIWCDVRLIYATKRRLEDLRDDLRWRIDQAVIRVPTLLERIDDIESHVGALFELARVRLDRAEPFRIEREALQAFREYSWPGNIRELGNVVFKIALARLKGRLSGLVDAGIVLSKIAECSVENDASNGIAAGAGLREPVSQPKSLSCDLTIVALPDYILTFRPGEAFDVFTARVLVQTYDYLILKGLSHTQTAQMLSIDRSALYSRLKAARKVVAPTQAPAVEGSPAGAGGLSELQLTIPGV